MKKVLIIGVPRSGTTSLVESFRYNGFKTSNEPHWQSKLAEVSNFDYIYNLTKSVDRKLYPKLAVKVTNSQYDGYPSTDQSQISTYFKSLVSLFDKTILLDRLDFEDHFISYCNLLGKHEDNWSAYDSYLEENVDIDDEHRETLQKDKQQLRYISEVLNLPIYYYEDIYYGDPKKVFEKEKIPFSEEQLKFLNPINRQRKVSKSII